MEASCVCWIAGRIENCFNREEYGKELVAVREQNSSENTDLAQILSSCGFKEAAFCLLSGEWGSVLSKVNFILSMGEAAFLKQ